ncbi:response regulator [Candidatus Aerophobetes bacterium]|nr:response regulator [Candidatus Aerophobetes bacterium]
MKEIKILTIDDSGIMRKIIKGHLAKIGYSNVIEASNGKEGLKKLSEEKIDLILCDWNMPEMNGLQFVQRVREEKNYGNIRIIMLTTVTTQDEVLTALKAGANSYITKPFKPENLKEKIEEVFKD